MTLDDWLDACAAEPDDDATRLVFADWLDERGDPDRAEFVRLQVRFSRQPQRDPREDGRAVELLLRHRAAWLRPVSGPSWADGWRFSRGLPEEVMLRRPAVSAEEVADLAASPDLARVVTLEIVGAATDAVAVALAGSPYLIRLRTLDLGRNDIGDRGAAALAGSAALARLTTLDLGDNAIGDAGAVALANSPYLAGLATLNLWSNMIGDAGAAALAGSPYLTRLVSLGLGSNRIGDAGAEALAGAGHLLGLTQLDLTDNRINRPARRQLIQVFGRRLRGLRAFAR